MSNPINDVLPFEVISHTFTFIDPSDPQNGNLPLALSLVCKTWQEIALQTPSVWTCIRIQGLSAPVTNDVVDALKERFQKSGGMDCHLFLEFSYKFRQQTFKSVVSAVVQPIASRLETLYLCVPASFLGDLANVKPFQFPRLRSYTITFPKDDRSRFIPIKELPPDPAPQLRSLDLQHGKQLGIIHNPKTSFAWSGLTHLKLRDRGLPAYEALEIFCLSTNLVHCELTIPGWHLSTLRPPPANLVSVTPQYDPYHPPCIHPHLRFLKLEFTSGAVSAFFARLSLPKLEDLRLITNVIVDPQEVHNALLAMAERHPIEGLKRLEMDRFPCSADTIIRFLKKNEEIETLKLKACNLSEEGFLGKLIIVPETPENGQHSDYAYAALASAFASATEAIASSEFLKTAASSILPKLKHIWLKGTSYIPQYDGWSGNILLVPDVSHTVFPKDQTVRAFLKSRSPEEGGTLKKMVMDDCRVENEGLLNELVKLKAGGMVLELGLESPTAWEDLSSNNDDWWVT